MKYNMEVRAFDKLSTEGVSHDDFKAIKACNFANRTPLRFVHILFSIVTCGCYDTISAQVSLGKTCCQLRMCRIIYALVAKRNHNINGMIQLLRIFRALQTSRVLHISMNAR